jgi:NodT family efflux transporter outer membrane factor (OMF) lipoprotein
MYPTPAHKKVLNIQTKLTIGLLCIAHYFRDMVCSVKKSLLILITFLFLSGCTLQGEVPLFNFDFPASFQNDPDKPADNINEYMYQTWWTRYNDPILNQLIARLLNQNLELKAAGARSLQAQERLFQTQGGLYPSISLDATAARSATPTGASTSQTTTTATTAGFATTSDTTYSTSYELGLSAAWQVDLFGQVRNSISAAEAGLKASEAEKNALAQNLIIQLIGQRVRLATLSALIGVTEETIENRRKILQTVERRYELGSEQISALDVRLAKENLERAKADLAPLEADYKEAFYTLEILVGEMPGTSNLQGIDSYTLLPPPERLKIPPPVALLDRRPDLQSAAYRIEAAKANIGVALADLYPGLSLSGSYGYQATELDNLISPEQIAWNLIGNLTAPLFEGGRLRATIRLREAEAEELAANYAQSILQAVGDVETALKREDELRNQLDALSETLRQAEQAYDLAYQRYTRGLVGFTELLEIERRIFQTRIQLLQVEQSVWQARLNLMLALGGDWLGEEDEI